MHERRTAPGGPGLTRRRVVGALAVGGAGLLVPTAAGARRQRRRRRRFRTITRTFVSTGNITIPELGPANPYPSVIEVAGFKRGKIRDVNVFLFSLTHTVLRDIDLMLQAPTGQRTILMSDIAANGSVTDSGITIDDEAPIPFPLSGDLTSGSYRPTNVGPGDVFPAPGAGTPNVRLSTFDGLNPNGTWRLFIVDDLSGFQGSLFRWELTIRARVRR